MRANLTIPTILTCGLLLGGCGDKPATPAAAGSASEATTASTSSSSAPGDIAATRSALEKAASDARAAAEAQAQQRIADAQAAQRAAEAKVADLERHLGEVQAKAQAQFDQAKAAVTGVKDDAGARYQAVIDRLTAERDALKQKLAEAQAKIDDLTAQKVALEAKVKELNERVKADEAKLAELSDTARRIEGSGLRGLWGGASTTTGTAK